AIPAATRLTAWKDGYFIAGTSLDTSPVSLRLRRLPEEDCSRYEWGDPTPDPTGRHNCGHCPPPIYPGGAPSGHARALSHRHFPNLYDGTDWHGNSTGWTLLSEHPTGAGVCASCHAPTFSYTDPDDPFDIRKARGVATHGVHCDYCHKIAGPGDGTIGV